MKILDLVLKGQWYDMIASGEKNEEYREVKPYWEKRLLDYEAIKRDYTMLRLRQFLVVGINPLEYPRGFTHVRFRRGYTSTAMVFPIESITIGIGNPDMGAPIDRVVFIIKFGETDETRNDGKNKTIITNQTINK